MIIRFFLLFVSVISSSFPVLIPHYCTMFRGTKEPSPRPRKTEKLFYFWPGEIGLCQLLNLCSRRIIHRFSPLEKCGVLGVFQRLSGTDFYTFSPKGCGKLKKPETLVFQRNSRIQKRCNPKVFHSCVSYPKAGITKSRNFKAFLVFPSFPQESKAKNFRLCDRMERQKERKQPWQPKDFINKTFT